MILKLWFNLLVVLILSVGCSTITKRSYPIIDGAVFKGNNLNGSLEIRFVPDTEYTYYIETPLVEAVEDTKLFNEVSFKNINIGSLDYSYFTDDEELLREIYERLPNVDPRSSKYVLDFIVVLRKINTRMWRAALSTITLGIHPSKTDFAYVVGIRLHHKGEIKNLVLSESYSNEKSIIPSKDSHLQFSWEKEPLVNLVKVALEKYRSEGMLR